MLNFSFVLAQNLLGATDSIYSLSMNPTGTVCVAGTSEKVSKPFVIHVSTFMGRTINAPLQVFR